ncbi:MAG: hypothetical protein EAZ76_10700 [Nostocales cyanobacterium]|nr:MAG: hypothetical protein EAZ76_10700 [Nostocales cyanobacterium]
MGRWGGGEMGRWGDGEVGRWGGGEVGRWGDGEVGRQGEVGRKRFLPMPNAPCPMPSHLSY